MPMIKHHADTIMTSMLKPIPKVARLQKSTWRGMSGPQVGHVRRRQGRQGCAIKQHTSWYASFSRQPFSTPSLYVGFEYRQPNERPQRKVACLARMEKLLVKNLRCVCVCVKEEGGGGGQYAVGVIFRVMQSQKLTSSP